MSKPIFCEKPECRQLIPNAFEDNEEGCVFPLLLHFAEKHLDYAEEEILGALESLEKVFDKFSHTLPEKKLISP